MPLTIYVMPCAAYYLCDAVCRGLCAIKSRAALLSLQSCLDVRETSAANENIMQAMHQGREQIVHELVLQCCSGAVHGRVASHSSRTEGAFLSTDAALMSTAGGSEMLMGYTLFAMCVAEVPVFFYTGALLKRVGIDPVLHVVLGCLVLRSLAYTAMPRFAGPWLAAPVRALSLLRMLVCVRGRQLTAPSGPLVRANVS